MRDALRAAPALAPAPNGFTVAEFTAKVHALTGTVDWLTSRRRAQTRPHPPLPRPPPAARTIAAPRDQVIAPILAGIPQPEDGTQTRALDTRRP